MTTKNIILLGDSITNGFDGHHDLEHNISYYLKKLMPNYNITNAGVNAGTISGNTERDLSYQVHTHDFKNYEIATIAYGTNDFAHSYNTLEIVKRILQKNINTIKKENPKIILLGILPTNRFDGGKDNIDISGIAQYSFKELLIALTDVYQQNKMPVLNWRKIAPNLINQANYQSALGDQRLHPNARTYKKMAQIMEQFITKNIKKD